jgi:LDH2 family malate/lactate/ureidoglycolate dehydrogenase
VHPLCYNAAILQERRVIVVHIRADVLQDRVQQVFAAAGVPEDRAVAVAESLVESDLVGHDSHGVLRVGSYVDAIDRGSVDPTAEPEVLRSSATTAVVDGHRGLGILMARQAMAMAMSRAKEHDLGMVALRNVGHTGRMGEYAVQAAREGYVSSVMAGGPKPGGNVAPYGGTSPVFNTNPMAWGLPANCYPAVFLDFATSVAAWGKIQSAIDKGESIPEGWLLDADGHPTTDPQQVRGGTMLPFGAHKGSGLAFLVEALCGGLSGASCAPLPDYAGGHVLIMTATRVDAFQPLESFRARIDGLVAAVRNARPAEGFSEILAAGEHEWHTRAKRIKDGLDIPEAAWERIIAAGTRHGVVVTL